jgi:hypothetical protein
VAKTSRRSIWVVVSSSTDFSERDAGKLTSGLHADPATAGELLTRILYWTDGHPHLTQALCSAVARHPGTDSTTNRRRRLPEAVFSSRCARAERQLPMVAKRLFYPGVDRDAILGRYQAIRNGDNLPDDAEDPLTSRAETQRHRESSWTVAGLFGIESHEQVFDDEWVREQLTPDEVRRQALAVRKARNRTLMASAAVLIGNVGILGGTPLP